MASVWLACGWCVSEIRRRAANRHLIFVLSYFLRKDSEFNPIGTCAHNMASDESAVLLFELPQFERPVVYRAGEPTTSNKAEKSAATKVVHLPSAAHLAGEGEVVDEEEEKEEEERRRMRQRKAGKKRKKKKRKRGGG